MYKLKSKITLGAVIILGFSIGLSGCFSNPVDPISGGGGSGNIIIHTSDTTTTSVTGSYSQASNDGIFISMRDQDGNALSADYFTNANFEVTWNSTQVASGSLVINTAGGSGQSISSALVLDYSGSMGTQDKTDMESGAVTFINNMQSADRGEIIKFGSSVYREQVYTTNKSLLTTAITASTGASGSTALYDAIYLGLTDTAQELGQRAVVAFTDGYENYSSHSMSDIVNFARNNGIPIYMVGLGSVDVSSLQSIANQTNGLYYFAPDSAGLAAIYQRIAQIFNNTLLITWPSFTYRSGDAIIITVTYSCHTGTYMSTINIVLP